MADTVVQGLSADASRIPSKWNRQTVADGDWLQKKTLAPLSARDVYLAEQIDKGNGDVTYVSGKIDELSGKTLVLSGELNSTSSFLSGAIDSVSAGVDFVSAGVDGVSSIFDDFYTNEYEQFVRDVTQSADDLNGKIDDVAGDLAAEIVNRTNADEELQNQIDKLEAATDVICVYGTYSGSENSFSNASGDLFKEPEHLTENDVIKVLNDNSDTGDGGQTYWQATNVDWSTSSCDWTRIGKLDPYYTKSEINTITADIASDISNTYLSAKGAVHQGKNIVVTEDSTKPEITISTSANVEFTTVSSNGFSGTNLSGATKHDTIDNLFGSAYSGAEASAWINDNKTKIAYTADFKGTNNVVTGYGTSAFAGGISSISAKTGNSTALFTGYNVNLQAGEGVGFNYGTNLLTISAEGKTYADGDYIKITGDTNKINVTGTLINSAQSGQSAYNWITTKSATLQAGQGIGFYSAGPNILGISADGATYSSGRCIEISSDNSINLSANVSATSYYTYDGDTNDFSACTISSNGIEFKRTGSNSTYPYYRNAFDGSAINIHYDSKNGLIEDVNLKPSTIVYSQTAQAPAPTFSVTGNWSNIISASKLQAGSGIEIFHSTNDCAIYLTANKYTYQTTAYQQTTLTTILHEETACSSLELRALYPAYPTEVANNVIVYYNNTAVGSLIPIPPSYSTVGHNNYYLAAQPAGGNSQERHWEPVSSITADCISSNNIDAIITATSVGSKAGYVYLI